MVNSLVFANVIVEMEIAEAEIINVSVLNNELSQYNISNAEILSQNPVVKIRSQECVAGTFSNSNSTECAPCAAGSAVSVSRASSCPLCAPGTWAGQAGLSECALCGPNHYAPNTGTTECTPCYTNSSSAEGAVDCTCNAGYFRVVTTLPLIATFVSVLLPPAANINVPHLNCF